MNKPEIVREAKRQVTSDLVILEIHVYSISDLKLTYVCFAAIFCTLFSLRNTTAGLEIFFAWIWTYFICTKKITRLIRNVADLSLVQNDVCSKNLIIFFVKSKVSIIAIGFYCWWTFLWCYCGLFRVAFFAHSKQKKVCADESESHKHIYRSQSFNTLLLIHSASHVRDTLTNDS